MAVACGALENIPELRVRWTGYLAYRRFVNTQRPRDCIQADADDLMHVLKSKCDSLPYYKEHLEMLGPIDRPFTLQSILLPTKCTRSVTRANADGDMLCRRCDLLWGFLACSDLIMLF